jgi:hypothetical protein
MTRDRHEPGEHWVSGVPEGTEIIHNPSSKEREETIGFPEESEFIERHGRRFHLIEGRNRIVIEMAHYVEVRRHGHEELVDERTLYVLPLGTELLEARRIGYKLLQLPHPSEAERDVS